MTVDQSFSDITITHVAQKNSSHRWLFCGGMFLVGLFFLTAFYFHKQNGTTPEIDLVVVTGAATNAKQSTLGRLKYLPFTVNKYTVHYQSDMPHFEKVQKAIFKGEPITIGISSHRETLFPRNGWVPLYKVEIQGETALSYQQTLNSGYRVSNGPLIIGWGLLLISGWGL